LRHLLAVDKWSHRFISFSQLAATLLIGKMKKLGHETYGRFGS
jgi:hypothetical protein